MKCLYKYTITNTNHHILSLLSFIPQCFVDNYLSNCPFSIGHCNVFPFSIYGLWLPFWYLQTFLCLFSIGHCIVCPSLIGGLWLPIWYLLISLTNFTYCVGHIKLWLI